MAALTTFNGKKGASTEVNRKNSSVNGIQPDKKPCKQRSTGKIVTLTTFNRKESGVDGVQLEKSGVNAVQLET